MKTSMTRATSKRSLNGMELWSGGTICPGPEKKIYVSRTLLNFLVDGLCRPYALDAK